MSILDKLTALCDIKSYGFLSLQNNSPISSNISSEHPTSNSTAQTAKKTILNPNHNQNHTKNISINAQNSIQTLHNNCLNNNNDKEHTHKPISMFESERFSLRSKEVKQKFERSKRIHNLVGILGNKIRKCYFQCFITLQKSTAKSPSQRVLHLYEVLSILATKFNQYQLLEQAFLQIKNTQVSNKLKNTMGSIKSKFNLQLKKYVFQVLKNIIQHANKLDVFAQCFNCLTLYKTHVFYSFTLLKKFNNPNKHKIIKKKTNLSHYETCSTIDQKTPSFLASNNSQIDIKTNTINQIKIDLLIFKINLDQLTQKKINLLYQEQIYPVKTSRCPMQQNHDEYPDQIDNMMLFLPSFLLDNETKSERTIRSTFSNIDAEEYLQIQTQFQSNSSKKQQPQEFMKHSHSHTNDPIALNCSRNGSDKANQKNEQGNIFGLGWEAKAQGYSGRMGQCYSGRQGDYKVLCSQVTQKQELFGQLEHDKQRIRKLIDNFWRKKGCQLPCNLRSGSKDTKDPQGMKNATVSTERNRTPKGRNQGAITINIKLDKNKFGEAKKGLNEWKKTQRQSQNKEKVIMELYEDVIGKLQEIKKLQSAEDNYKTPNKNAPFKTVRLSNEEERQDREPKRHSESNALASKAFKGILGNITGQMKERYLDFSEKATPRKNKCREESNKLWSRSKFKSNCKVDAAFLGEKEQSSANSKRSIKRFMTSNRKASKPLENSNFNKGILKQKAHGWKPREKVNAGKH